MSATDEIRHYARAILDGDFHGGTVEDKARLIIAFADQIDQQPKATTAGLEDLKSLDQFRILVAAGMYDGDLGTISDIVSTRKKLLAAERDARLVESLEIGDKVITKNVNPQYLAGRVGTVKQVLPNGRISVDMGVSIRKYSRVLDFLPSQLTKTGD